MALKVKNEVKVYEVDGKETTVGSSAALLVESHWNNDALVNIQFAHDGRVFTVLGKELKAAVDNATNVVKF